MKKKLLSMLLSTALVAGMTVVWMPMEVSAGEVCPYGDVNCDVNDPKGTHEHIVYVGNDIRAEVTEIKEGIFTNTIMVCTGGKISGGTFIGQVFNDAGAKIAGGIFQGLVMNHGTIEEGCYEEEVVNYKDGSITGGMFYGEVENQSSPSNDEERGKIYGGEYHAKVLNTGDIQAGSFYEAVENDYRGIITDGSFWSEVTNSGRLFLWTSN